MKTAWICKLVNKYIKWTSAYSITEKKEIHIFLDLKKNIENYFEAYWILFKVIQIKI